jgi:hypothetical protein
MPGAHSFVLSQASSPATHPENNTDKIDHIYDEPPRMGSISVKVQQNATMPVYVIPVSAISRMMAH